MHQIQLRDFPDDSPMAAFYHQHALMVLAYIRPHVPAKEDAEDILVDVFLAVLENPVPLDLSEQAQLAWLRRVAHNKLVDRYRREARQPRMSSLDELAQTLLGEDDEGPENVAVRGEDRTYLHSQLAKLPVEQQEVLYLRFTENLSTREIARLLNKSDVAVRSALSRTLNRLRRICEPQKEGKIHHG